VAERELFRGAEPVDLPPKAFDALFVLVSRHGHVVEKDELMKTLWPDTFVEEDSLVQQISHLRKLLGVRVGGRAYIETIPRRGYRFAAPVAESWEEEPEAAGKRRAPAVSWTVAVPLLAAIGAAILLFLNFAGLRDSLLHKPKPAPPQITSIAVLPLENLSRDPEQEYFADGMTEELITTLGKISALRVISRTSMMRYKQARKPLPEIARELNVDAVIEGTVLHSGGRVRVTANLLHAPTDRHLWAQSYERDAGDVLTLQRELARTVAKEVRATLSPEEQERLGRSRRLNPEAHELYLKGQYHYYKWRRAEFAKAVDYFQRALAADPDYAQAYLALAKTYGWQWMQGTLPQQEAYPKFSAALKRALEIDDTLPEAHYVLAVSAWYFYWNWTQAEAEFKRALALNPNFEEARFEYAWFLTTMGRHEEAIAEAERAVECDPLSFSANLALGSNYSGARQFDKALAQYRKTIELDPNDPRGYEFLAGVYAFLGLYDESVKARQKQMTLAGAKPEDVAAMGEAYRSSGFTGYLRWRLERATHPYQRAIIQAQLGLKDEALMNLEKAYRQHWWAMVQLNNNPGWDPLRSDPRFQELLRRMNFPP
jgi:TolB-like protein/DNA-binding winged helix-turn-helix (wHTH) protein/Tfp pilus assembly protein PilF